MSKMKSLLAEYVQSLASDKKTKYCCYCLDRQDDKITCCGEEDFVLFKDLIEEDQKFLINSELDAAYALRKE